MMGNGMMSLEEAARALGARIVGIGADAGERASERIRFDSVSTDSRTLPPGALFVALRGDRFDGHQFLAAVRARGAAGSMIDAAGMPLVSSAAGRADTLPAIVVTDTRRGLGHLATVWRARFAIPLIGVAGSNGKTTVKEMIAAILKAHYGEARTLATAGNLNNDIGLPLTLLRLRAQHACAVIELGMNHPGETKELAQIAQPTVALVNNAQREHQEFMASVADVAREHGALFEALPSDGIAVINADDAYADYWRGLNAGRVVRDFSIERRAAVTARYALGDAGSDITLETPEGEVQFSLQVAGLHNVRNAVAAATAATAAGADLDSVASALASFTAVRGRLQRKAGRHGAVVIDDTYNANPDSVRAAVDVLARVTGRRVLVLGDMGEVGAQGPAFHAEIGCYAKERGVDRVMLAGELTRHVATAFGAGADHYERFEDLLAAIVAWDGPDTTVLVKGSRFMRMERAVAALTGETA